MDAVPGTVPRRLCTKAVSPLCQGLSSERTELGGIDEINQALVYKDNTPNLVRQTRPDQK